MKTFNYLVVIFLLVYLSHRSAAQTLDFNTPDTVCLNEAFKVVNSSNGYENINWDYCQGDLKLNPTALSLNYSSLNIPVGTYLIKYNDLWYGFICNMFEDGLVRLDFGENLNNPSPVINDLGNMGGELNRPQDIKIIEDQGNYFAFTYNRGSNQLVRINFGTDLTNPSPSSDILLTGSGYTNGGLDVEFDGTNWVVILTNAGNITLVNLGNSASNIPTAGAILNSSSISGVNGIGDIKIVEEGGNWFGIIVGFASQTIHRLDFGSSLFADPTPTQLTVPEFSASGLQPYGITGAKEENDWIFFLATIQGSIARINFGESISNDTPESDILGNLGALSNTLKIDMAIDNSRWVALTSQWNSTNYFLIEFPQAICNFDQSASTNDSTILASLNEGDHAITLRGNTSNGLQRSLTKMVHVKSTSSPSVEILTEFICINTPYTLNANSDNLSAIQNWNWNFGDGSTASTQEPEHNYTALGDYFVTLSIEADNGCNNFTTKIIKVIEPPIASFSSSSQGAICSEKPVDFTNTTTLPAPATFAWDFGDGNFSTEENPTHTYASAGNYEVSLNIEMAGCLSTINQTVTVNEGPQVSFADANQCEGKLISFSNTSSGNFITGYQWDFGDGTTSTLANPSHLYETVGIKEVQLTAFTSNGCNYTINQQVEVYPIPSVDFEVEPSCAAAPTQFLENVSLTGANVTDYLWDFGISASNTDLSSQADPNFTFAEAGTYTVLLQVTTEDGCTAQLSKEVVVNALPQPTINYTPNCLDQAFSFSGNASANINSEYWEIRDELGMLLTSSTQNTFEYTFPAAGNYSVSYRQQNQQLCSNTVSETITVNEAPVAFFDNSAVCVGNTESITNNSQLNGNNLASQAWYVNNELISTDATLTYTFEEAQEYEVRLLIETDYGCQATYTDTIAVISLPTAQFELPQEVGAIPFQLDLTADLQADEQAIWFINGIEAGQGALLSTSLDTTGLHLIQLEVRNANNCVSTFAEQLNLQQPILNIAVDQLQAIQRNDFTEFIISLNNKGSLVPDYYQLVFDFGEFSITERLDAIIYPGDKINQRLNVQLSAQQLSGIDRVCIEVEPVNLPYQENQLTDNKACVAITKEFKVLKLYPNPSKGVIRVPVNLPEAASVQLIIESVNGQTYESINYEQLAAGYHELSYDKGTLKAGIYLVRVIYAGQENMQKVVFY